jgi:hypothetical protein
MASKNITGRARRATGKNEVRKVWSRFRATVASSACGKVQAAGGRGEIFNWRIPQKICLAAALKVL